MPEPGRRAATALALAPPLFALALSLPPDASWRLTKEEGEIRVYRREGADSGPSEFMGVSRDAVRLEIAYQVLTDLASYPAWVDYLAESRILSRGGPDDLLVYQRFDLPWPFADRDIVVRVALGRDYPKGFLKAVLRAEDHPEVPAPSGCLRIPLMEGEIGLRYVSREVTEGYFAERLDLGGSIPGWLKGLFNREIPFAVLKRLSAECRKPRYAEAAAASPEKAAIERAVAEGMLPP